jgi:hypothetical protein
MRTNDRGQVIVILGFVMIAMLAFAGLIIDGGTAWAHQRDAQNAADAAAKAGAIVLAQKATYDDPTPVTPAEWGERVRNEVNLSAVRNRVTLQSATYTDGNGDPLTGQAVDGRPVPATAVGVQAVASRTFQTHLARIMGQTTWSVGQSATAITGPSTGCTETVSGCILLPITFPITVFACGRGNTSVPELPARTWPTDEEITIPLCGGNPGSVGWIDWTPTAGGTSELTAEINNPTNRDIPLPSWQYITETGDISAAQVEDALNRYVGQVVLFPIFDSTCNITPTNNQTSGCPAGNTGGTGVNQWYHISHFLYFTLKTPKGAFVNGDNSVACAAANAKECVKGAFVQLLGEGAVVPCTAACPEDANYSVQLIR